MLCTFIPEVEGFGALLQKLVWAILIVETSGNTFIYTPITKIEHNYNDDTEYIDMIENYIGLKAHYINKDDKSVLTPSAVYIPQVIHQIEANINEYHSNDVFKRLKALFFSNKKTPYDTNSTHIAVHIRRSNLHDNGIQRGDTPDIYYLSIMNTISSRRKNEKLTFHIYSQGEETNFIKFLKLKNNNIDVRLHINEHVIETFNGLLFSDILVLSKSSLSYIAAIFSNAEVHYIKFYHNPLSHWKVYSLG